MSKKKYAELEAVLEKALNNAVHVSNDLELKTAIGKKELAIISNDTVLYARLLEKIPKERVSAGSKSFGKLLVGLGAAISIMSFGLFAFIGVPMAGAGAVMGTIGIALDDYKDYSLALDYDKKEVVFLKVKGSPCLQIPKGMTLKKLAR